MTTGFPMRKNRDPYRDPLVAGMLACIPGAGHLYCGEPLRAVTYLAGIAAGLFLFVVPGVFLWAASIPDAVLCARRRNQLLPPRLHPSITHITDGPDPAGPPAPSPQLPLDPETASDPSPESFR